MKLILGTVQFGMPYGVLNTLGHQPGFEDVVSMLDYAWENKIRTLDSAIAYGIANQRIAEYHQKTKRRFNVINKIIRNPLRSLDEFKSVKISMKEELRQMDLPHFEVIMLHYAPSVCKPFSHEHFYSLVEEGIALKIGLSISTEADYRLVEKDFQFNVIQLPLNILNQLLIPDSFLSELKNKGIEIHARSIFMQGLLASENPYLPEYLQALNPYLMKIKSLAVEHTMSLKTMALTFLMENKHVDKIVFGVQSTQELVEILDSFNEISHFKEGSIQIAWNKLACPYFFLVDPNQWPMREK